MSNETINMRVDSARKQRLQAAADLSYQSLSAFVLAAADARADEILNWYQYTEMSAEFFDKFFGGPVPEPTPALREAVAAYKKYVRSED